MKRKIGCLFGTMVLITSIFLINQPVLSGETEQTKEPVAVVNGKEISGKLFDFALSNTMRMVSRSGRKVNDKMLVAIKKKVLEDLIYLELLYQECVAKGIKIDETRAEDVFKNLKKGYESEEEYKKALREQGIDEEIVKFQFMRRWAVESLIEEQNAENLKVTEDEMKAFYYGNKKALIQPESVRASHILIKVAPNADETAKSESKKKIEEIQKRLKQGEDFAAVAKEVSECPSASKGGDLGYFQRGAMVKAFEDVAFGLKPGETSDIVETQFGYHLIKVFDKKDETNLSFEDVKDKIQSHLKYQKMEKAMQAYAEKLKETAKIERLISLN